MSTDSGRGISQTRASPLADEYRASGYWRADRLDDPIVEQARLDPDRTALIDRDRHVSYGQLLAAIERAAGTLRDLGIGRGDVVSFQLPNWLEAAIVHHATARLGGVSNPIVPIYRGRELRFILRQARTRVLVIPDVFRRFDYRAMVAEMRSELPELAHVLVAGEPIGGMESFADLHSQGTQAPAAERSAEDVVVLLYTSGTEANPKGVLHSHATLLYECRSIIELYGVSAADRVFMPSPLTHITGLLYGLHLPFMLGTSVVLQDVWAPDAAVDLIERERCTFAVGATPFLHGIVHSGRRVESMRVFACGGADVPPGLIYEAEERLGMRASRAYGSTECPTVTGTSITAPTERHARTDGRPIGGAQVRIVDQDGAEVGPGRRGELQARGPDLCLGYLDSQLNERAFTADGWFRSGDLAIADEEGYLRISGRVKDVIVRGGENLSAKEIEDLIFEHPEVDEVAIVGYPDEVLGERACAVIVTTGEVSLEDLTGFLRSRQVANQKLPERLLRIDALPKTASGKVQKYRLRDMLRSEVASA